MIDAATTLLHRTLLMPLYLTGMRRHASIQPGAHPRAQSWFRDGSIEVGSKRDRIVITGGCRKLSGGPTAMARH